MTVDMLTKALEFLRKEDKHFEKAFCQRVWDISKCGDGDCEDCPLFVLNTEFELEDDRYGQCVRSYLQEQMWKLERCTARIEVEPEPEQEESEVSE